MSPLLQSRLLRVLQEKEVRRVGDNVPIYVNVRVLAATNEPLEQRIKEGTFREDLYYRLNVIAINLPSLRERREDIPLLVSHFLRNKLDPRTGQSLQITRQAMEVLTKHDWPGNVRELENAVERACVLCENRTIRVADLPPIFRKYSTDGDGDELAEIPEDAPVPPPSAARATVLLSSNGSSAATAVVAAPTAVATVPLPSPALGGRSLGSLKDYLREQEVAYLTRALAQTGNDKEKTATLLGISLATLYRKLAEAEIA
jgi:DNA-binding NtrC family response regulator